MLLMLFTHIVFFTTNDCYKYATAINAKGEPFSAEPLIMALLLLQHKMIDWLTAKQISKHEYLDNNKKEVKKSKQLQERDLHREITHDYIRKNKRIHYIDNDDY
jgi:hypothetical protein